MSGTDPNKPVGVPRDMGPVVDEGGVMRCPPLHAPGIPHQGNRGRVNALLPVEGHLVAQGQLVMRLETDFAIIDVPSPIDGVVDEFLVSPGREIKTGDPLWRYLSK